VPAAAPVDLSPVALLAAFLGMFIGPELLPLASAYAVISAGALIGAFVGLYRRAPCSAMQSVGFVLIVWLATTFCTVPIATWIAARFQQSTSWWFFPVAMGCAGIGEDWIKLSVDAVAAVWRKKFGGTQQ